MRSSSTTKSKCITYAVNQWDYFSSYSIIINFTLLTYLKSFCKSKNMSNAHISHFSNCKYNFILKLMSCTLISSTEVTFLKSYENSLKCITICIITNHHNYLTICCISPHTLNDQWQLSVHKPYVSFCSAVQCGSLWPESIA